jgi:hypothetical protein
VVGQLEADNLRRKVDLDGRIGMLVGPVSLMHPRDSHNHGKT